MRLSVDFLIAKLDNISEDQVVIVTNVHDWIVALEKQRRSLRMPLTVLADRAGVSRATVCRIFEQKKTSSSLENVLAIARVLGAELRVDIQDPEDMIEGQVQKLAKKIARMVQGTMALESQGITDPEQIARLVETAAAEIRAKPRKHLWVRQCRSSSRSRAKPPIFPS
jgi:transcriptional regulator with XRE-family HTH domain